MRNIIVLFKREFMGYFTTPIAYVFTVLFLVLLGIMTFVFGAFFERGQADLASFFTWHPWLYMLFIPALTMGLWAEERKTGSIELLLTLPITMMETVAGKFLAAWAFTAVSLFLTFPIWITVNYLGNPDNGTIFAGYFGSFLMAGAFVAIGSCISATTKSQVIAFIISVVICFAFIMSGRLTLFMDWNPLMILDTISSFSFLTRFSDISRGVISLRDIVYFVSLIVLWLFVNMLVIEIKKSA